MFTLQSGFHCHAFTIRHSVFLGVEILTAEQIKAWDQYTIQHEPIASLDLMERASNKCVEWLLKKRLETPPASCFLWQREQRRRWIGHCTNAIPKQNPCHRLHSRIW